MPTINLRPNKLTLYKRPRSPLWQCRYKLDNGEWYRQSTGTDDKTEAEDIAFKLYYGAGEREKNNLPQNTRKFGNVARYAVTRLFTTLMISLLLRVVVTMSCSDKHAPFEQETFRSRSQWVKYYTRPSSAFLRYLKRRQW